MSKSNSSKDRRKRYNTKGPVVSIRVNLEMHEALVKEAERRGKSLSALLRGRLEKPFWKSRERERDVTGAWNEAKNTGFRVGYRVGCIDGRQRIEPRYEAEWLRKDPRLQMR